MIPSEGKKALFGGKTDSNQIPHYYILSLQSRLIQSNIPAPLQKKSIVSRNSDPQDEEIAIIYVN